MIYVIKINGLVDDNNSIKIFRTVTLCLELNEMGIASALKIPSS